MSKEVEDVEMITLTNEDGEQDRLYVLEQTTIAGSNYLLVCDSLDEEEANAWIFKEIRQDNEEVIYEPVEDDKEFEAISKVFEELVDDDTEMIR